MSKTHLFLFWAILLISQSCQPEKADFYSGMQVIPQPVEMKVGSGYFEINKNTPIYISEKKGVFEVADYFRQMFQKASGMSLSINEGSDILKNEKAIVFELSENIALEEGYELKVNEKRIHLRAKTAAGLFYGVQTMRQLLPLEIDASNLQNEVEWNMPSVNISDHPRFAWRGMHLDVSRHFFQKEFIKKYIDHLARYKFNKFHWHLTDGAGWRIEIEQFPELINTASWRVDKRRKSWDWSTTEIGKPTDGRPAYGGHYTKEDIREIIEYAAEHFIEVIPEIEMPGHSHAALMAYPELACENNDVPVDGVNGKDVFCAANEKTYAFLEGVIDEVVELFPSKLIHLGGDEVGKQAWKDCGRCQDLIKKEDLKGEEELQSFFIKKMAAYIEGKGKEVIGWDEILEGGLAPNAKVMSWQGMEGGIKSANMGHDVIMAPNQYTYFDLYQGNPKLEPDAYSRLYLSKVYEFDPIPEDIDADKRHHILGGHGCLWTEFVQTPEHAEYMIFPRLLALSETIWSPKENLNWDLFVDKMERHQLRWEKAGINFSRSAYQARINIARDTVDSQIQAEITNELGRHDIRYTTDGSEPDMNSELYDAPFFLNKKAYIKAATFRDGKRYGQISSVEYAMNMATGKKVVYKHKYSPRYAAGGDGGLVNGIFGTVDFHDGQWQGFQEDDVEILIDLDTVQAISYICTNFLHNPSSWIYLPKNVTFEISGNGKTFEKVAEFGKEDMDKNGVKQYETQFSKKRARYIKITGENIRHRPDRPTEKSWVFLDEVVVE